MFCLAFIFVNAVHQIHRSIWDSCREYKRDDMTSPRFRIYFIRTPAYQQEMTIRTYQSEYQMQEAFSLSNPQPRLVIHCRTMEFSCPIHQIGFNSMSQGKQNQNHFHKNVQISTCKQKKKNSTVA